MTLTIRMMMWTITIWAAIIHRLTDIMTGKHGILTIPHIIRITLSRRTKMITTMMMTMMIHGTASTGATGTAMIRIGIVTGD